MSCAEKMLNVLPKVVSPETDLFNTDSELQELTTAFQLFSVGHASGIHVLLADFYKQFLGLIGQFI